MLAAAGEKRRELWKEVPSSFTIPNLFSDFRLAIPGVLTLKAPAYINEAETEKAIAVLNEHLRSVDLKGLALIVLCDDASFTAASVNNLVWITFTRSNPANDIYGINSFTEHKHWGCRGPLIIDARKKPHHAPELIKDPEVEKRVDRLGERGGSLHGII